MNNIVATWIIGVLILAAFVLMGTIPMIYNYYFKCSEGNVPFNIRIAVIFTIIVCIYITVCFIYSVDNAY